MPFSEEDRYIIKHYREKYGWGSKKILKELGQDPDKNWSREGIIYLLRKIDTTGSIERKKGSGRPRSARTQENQEEVEELIFSQEDPDDGDWKRHDSPRAIAQRLGISKNSVY